MTKLIYVTQNARGKKNTVAEMKDCEEYTMSTITPEIMDKMTKKLQTQRNSEQMPSNNLQKKMKFGNGKQYNNT